MRKPLPYMSKTKLVARAYIMGQFGMLQCAANFSNGYGSKICGKCNVIDDESHRINSCTEWSSVNLVKDGNCINYEDIFSENIIDSMKVVDIIVKMWDLGNGRNSMRLADSD